jgi:DNA-binding Xre family transcriptional regulator
MKMRGLYEGCMSESENISPESAKLGQILRAARDRLGLKNGEIAAGLGLTEAAVKKIMKGVATTQFLKLGHLCRLLAITPNELLGFSVAGHSDLLRGNLESSYKGLGLSDDEARVLAEIVLEGMQEPPIQSVNLEPVQVGRIQGELALRKFARVKHS